MCTISTVFGTKIRFVFSVTFLVTGARIFGFAFFGFFFLSFLAVSTIGGGFVTLYRFARFTQLTFGVQRGDVSVQIEFGSPRGG